MTGLTVIRKQAVIVGSNETISTVANPTISTVGSRVVRRLTQRIDTIRFSMTGFAVLQCGVDSMTKNPSKTKSHNTVTTTTINGHDGMSSWLSLGRGRGSISMAGIA